LGQEAEQLIAAAAGQVHGPAGADRPIYLRAIKPPDASGGFFFARPHQDKNAPRGAASTRSVRGVEALF
jgi:hypothetical protein